MEKIDLKNVKIALNRDEMEEVVGGCCNAAYQIALMGFAGSMFGPVGAFGYTMLGIYLTSRNGGCI